MSLIVRLPTTSKLSLEEFKSSFMFGIPFVNTETGEEFSTEAFQRFIDISYEYLEFLYDIMILPSRIEHEPQDFFIDQAGRSFFMVNSDKVPMLWDPTNRNKWPVEIKAYYGEGLVSALFPNEWLRVNSQSGSIHIYPTWGNMGSFLHQFTALAYAQGVLRQEFVPQYYDLTYCAGFDPIPRYINSIVGKLSYIYIANILGDAGAGISSFSLSIDGLSQSISTIQSAKSNLYSARVSQYKEELKEELTLLKAKFGNIALAGI